MKKGDFVRSKEYGWLGRVTGNAANVRLVWLDGDLADREANVPRDRVEVVNGPARTRDAGDGPDRPVAAGAEVA